MKTRYKKRPRLKTRRQKKIRRGGTVPFLFHDLWGDIQDSAIGTARTFSGSYNHYDSSLVR